MDNENPSRHDMDFPYDLTDDLGEVIRAEQECPGVFYVSVDCDDALPEHEYYLIERTATNISEEAKSYGFPLNHHPELLAVPLNGDRSGSFVVRYELYRYRIRQNLPLPDGETLLIAGIYGMEDYPEYFGRFPPPRITPRGFTTRYKELMNGVFAVETDHCERMIAVCYPIWYDGFSPYTMRFAERTDFDRERGIDNTLGYLFFPERDACLAVFELMDGNPDLLKSELIEPNALHNAIWNYHPAYAAANNRSEQAGQHNLLGLIIRSLGYEAEPQRSSERFLRMTIDVGTEWLRL